MITVHDALDCGRDVFVHSAGSGAENYQKGTQNLINDGGIVINNYADICSWTLNSFKGKKRVEEIDYSQIEKLLSTGESAESFYRFTDKWYKIA